MDFVLKDPRKKLEAVQEPEEPHRKELLQVPKPWVKSVQAAYQTMEQVLLVTNPTMGAVLNLWYRDYRSVGIPVCTSTQGRRELEVMRVRVGGGREEDAH